jgi:asparagine synthase (glutamine-hydrolysing)
MCGITGYFTSDTGLCDALLRDLPAASSALDHRGPDGHGQWLSEDRTVGFGHRRLAIIDLSEHASQPMHSRCGRWVMVFNGEVYNFREIRQTLEPLGHRFNGSGDSEVILAAFAQWGVDACQRFIGMFAIALWHRPTHQLHLLRDRLGVKPLYYFWDGKTLLFGSELKALQAFRDWPREIDRNALADYLRFGYIADPLCIFKQVRKLPPAHHLVLAGDGRWTLTRYWTVVDAARQPVNRSEDELADELEALMTDAFKLRMIADVPVGVFLSGGIDSSVLAAILQKRAGCRIRTFTIGFDEAAYNEAPFAAAVARHLGTEHVTRIMRAQDAKRVLARWGELYDEPFADESGIATLMVAYSAAEEVKVVLSADGGDELFAGYTGYADTLKKWRRIRGIPLPLREAVAGALDFAQIDVIDARLASSQSAMARALHAKVTDKLGKVRKFLDARTIGALFERALCVFRPDEIDRLIGHAGSLRESADGYPGTDGEKLCLWDIHHYLPADILTKIDRATMAAGIEGREPLIDHRLAEFAFALPYHLRAGQLGSKHLLRKILYRHVPRPLVDRPKRGFGVPVKKWMNAELRDLLCRMLSPSRLAAQGLFDTATVQDYLRRLDAGDATVRQRLWYLLAFALWHERWMSAESPRSETKVTDLLHA